MGKHADLKQTSRSAEVIRRHYEIERELADRLRQASRGERGRLYGEVYDELFRRVPDHPQLQRKTEPDRQAVASQIADLRRFAGPADTFLEVGAGDCAVSLGMAGVVERVVAVDVSTQVSSVEAPPPNFELVLTDGCSIPVPDASVTVAYSNQLMEHLHPDDAREQLENIYRALAPGGVYICITPNRLSGPHDVSGGFDASATGFHLKEYTTGELADLLHDIGFSKVRALVQRGRFRLQLPVGPVRMIERALSTMPRKICRAIARRRPVAMVLGKVVAAKGV